MISTESAVTLLAVAGAIGLGYAQFGPNSRQEAIVPTTELTEQSSSKKGKKKGKKGTSSVLREPASFPIPATPPVVPFPDVIPGALETETSTPASEVTKSKKKKKAKPTKSSGLTTEDTSSLAAPLVPKKTKKTLSSLQDGLQSSMSIETDGSWTRVGSQRRGRQDASGETTSDAGVTTSVTGTSSPVAERLEEEDLPMGSRFTDSRKPLAERLLPKARKTGVEDMLETPDVPPVARVMRVQPRADEQPASGFSWADYEDVDIGHTTGGENDADGEDDGWGVVRSRRRAKPASAVSGNDVPTTAPEALTKKQRQNAKKREAEKATKTDAEKARLATLAKHQRGLEKERMIEQLKRSGGGKVPSGGMKAAVDDRGRLVWE